MRRTDPVALRPAIFLAFLLCAACAGPGAAADPASPVGEKGAAQGPAAATRFPEHLTGIRRQLDGGLICATTGRVLRSSVAAPTRWSDVALEGSELPHEKTGSGQSWVRLFFWPIGGERGCSYFTASGEEGRFLYVMEPGKPFRKIRDLPRAFGAGAFATKSVGALSEGDRLLLTTDGGVTWHPTTPVLKGMLSIVELLWISPTQLLAGVDDGSVQLLERGEDNGLRQVWRASVDPMGVRQIVPDGDFVWAGWRDLRRLRLADGQAGPALRPDTVALGAAVCNKFLLTWDRELIGVWAPAARGAKYANVAKIPCENVAAILPHEGKKCLVINTSGEGLLLDLNTRRLSPLALQVSLPPPRAEDPDAKRAMEELRTVISLDQKVPRAKAAAIFEEAKKRHDLTPRQQTLWAIGELERAIKDQGGPIAVPPPPTAEEVVAAKKEMRTELELGKQIPFAQTKIIVEEAVKNANLTDRERRQWIIKKYREYLATHKPDPDVNRTDATHEELVAMWALGAKVPDADRNVIFAEQRKKTEMTDLQKTRWATEQFRKYIDEHKAKDDKDTKKNAKD